MVATYGQNVEVGISFQDSYGTSNVDSMYWLPILSEDVGINKPPLVSQELRGIFDEGATYEGPNTCDGNVEMEADPIAIGVMLKAALDQSSSVAADDAYTHTFIPAVADFDEKCAGIPLTLYKFMDDGGSASLFYDLAGSELEIGITQGEFMTARLALVGGNFSQIADISPSFPEGKKWTWDTVSYSIGGTGLDTVTELTVTLTNNMEAQHTVASDRNKFPTRVKRTGFRMVSISGTMKFENQDEYQQFISQSERELDITLTGNVEVASGYYDTLRIQAPLSRYSEFKPSAGGPGPLEVSFTSRGVYSTSSATALRVTLTNTQAAY